MKKISTKRLLHIGFDIGLLLKGLNAAAEIVSGFALMFLSPERMNYLLGLLSGGELSEDPKDLIANYLVALGHNFTADMQSFAVFYMLSHGIVKLTVILLLWKGKLWAYPLSVLVFIVFIAYQLHRYALTHSVFMLLLTLLDIVMIFLTVMEYKRIRAERTGV